MIFLLDSSHRCALSDLHWRSIFKWIHVAITVDIIMKFLILSGKLFEILEECEEVLKNFMWFSEIVFFEIYFRIQKNFDSFRLFPQNHTEHPQNHLKLFQKKSSFHISPVFMTIFARLNWSTCSTTTQIKPHSTPHHHPHFSYFPCKTLFID